MTLDELSECWNELRNAALGRGIAPLVPAALADEVTREYAAWRSVLSHLPPAADMFGSYGTRQWINRYRKLLKKVDAAGFRPGKTLAMTPVETSLEALDVFGRNVAIGLGAAGLGLIIIALVRRS